MPCLRAFKLGFIQCSRRLGHQREHHTLQAAAEASGTAALGASGTALPASYRLAPSPLASAAVGASGTATAVRGPGTAAAVGGPGTSVAAQ